MAAVSVVLAVKSLLLELNVPLRNAHSGESVLTSGGITTLLLAKFNVPLVGVSYEKPTWLG